MNSLIDSSTWSSVLSLDGVLVYGNPSSVHQSEVVLNLMTPESINFQASITIAGSLILTGDFSKVSGGVTGTVTGFSFSIDGIEQFHRTGLSANVSEFLSATSGGEAIPSTAYAYGIASSGTALNDTISGFQGDDVLNGGNGGDVLIGGKGNDNYFIDSLGDSVNENAKEGIDTINSSIDYNLAACVNVENLTLLGGAILGGGNSGDNFIKGNAQDNILDGGAGNDTLDGGAGSDVLIGGAGNDVFIVNSYLDTIIENQGEGVDLVRSSISYTLRSNVENLTLVEPGSVASTGVLHAVGNAQDNLITGNSKDNYLDGGFGNDTLVGGKGADSMYGGLGNDTYVVDSIDDKVVEYYAEGSADVVRSSISYTLGSYIERLVLTGVSNINATGNSLSNVLTGNAGNNVITGGAGNDTMDGGAGIDTVNYSAAAKSGLGLEINMMDGYVTGGSTGSDRIFNFENVIGSSADDIILGTNAGNVINGGAGADIMYGAGGDDTYIVDNSKDVVNEAAGQGIDTVRSSVSYSLDRVGNSHFTENLILTGAASINAFGNELSNEVKGNSGANILDGKAGHDVLTGGLGNDTFIFSTKLSAANIDTITDFSVGHDVIALQHDIFNKLSVPLSTSASFHFDALNQSQFVANADGVARDANDFIVYETNTGKLFYDADGSGTGAAVQIALIGAHLALTSADFRVASGVLDVVA